MSKDKQDLGKKGERLALMFLRQKGYQIIARNFSSRTGEIDIVAGDNGTTVFVEVKTRSSTDFGRPDEAIDRKKIRHLYRCAQFYIRKHALLPEGSFRFDVVSVILSTPAKINLIKNAF
ncbi:YraN family protein [Candidatus Omnitrophota bacterium]